LEEIMTKELIAQMVEAAEKCLAHEAGQASNESIKTKLHNLSAVCKTIVMETKQPLSIPAVMKQYKGRFSDPKQSLSEQTIRNKRPNGNPYMNVYRAWETTARAMLAPPAAVYRKDGLILSESDLHTIKDPTLRHQVTLVFAQNRSLHNKLNILKKLQGQGQIRVSLDGADRPTLMAGDNLILTDAEIAAIRDFVDVRKLKAKHLKPSKDDGVSTIDDRPVADAGFLTALQKIAKSYERPE
jgi:hypothetical protein